MKEKTKKITWKIFKIVWAIVGIFIALGAFSLFTAMKKVEGLGVIVLAVLFAYSLTLLIGFIIITALFFLIKFIIKKLKNKKRK